MKREPDHYGSSLPRAGELPLFAQPVSVAQVQFDAPSAPTPSSEAAADALSTPSGKARRQSQNRRLLALLAARESGYTREELAEASGIPINVICARVHDCAAMGWLDKSSEITRLTKTGSKASVLFITSQGRAVLATERAA